MFRTHAARFFPELFPALVLIDPAIIPVPISPGMIWADGWGATESLVAICDSAVSRRNGWESKYEFYHPLRLVLTLRFVPGQKHYNFSRVSPSVLLGIHFR